LPCDQHINTNSKKMAKKNSILPIQDSNSMKEDDSVDAFKKLIKPWKVISLSGNYPAIDLIIEQTGTALGSKNNFYKGKRFSVQLKSRTIDKQNDGNWIVSIETKTLNSWAQAFEPIMLALYEADSNEIYYLWIDDLFFSELNQKNSKWISRQKINISIPSANLLSKSELPKLEKFLNEFKKIPKKYINHGTYIGLRNEFESVLKEFIAILNEKSVTFNISDLTLLKDKVSNAIYKVAVVGPSRAGKSTLINALVNQEISPVETLPTTGIPFTIMPGIENYAEIIFEDGSEKRVKPEAKFLKQYIDQKINRNNKEAVKLITVYIKDEKLEKGLAFCDVPGLDDPDSKIEQISQATILTANAIIYLIDVSPHLFGSFSITAKHINDLKLLAPKRDRLFLLFNKFDVLKDKKEREKLQVYINDTLARYDILNSLAQPPIYISAEKLRQDKKNKVIEHLEIEKQLWDHLLKNNKTGLHTLHSLSSQTSEELNKLGLILSARLIKTKESKVLKTDLDKVNVELSKLYEKGNSEKDELTQWLETYINDSVANILSELKVWLESHSPEVKLPGTLSYRDYLEQNSFMVLDQIYEEVNYKLDMLYNTINSWVKESLSQAELTIKDNTSLRWINEERLKKIVNPITATFAETARFSDMNFVEKAVVVAADIISELWNLLKIIFVGKTKIRKNKIDEIMASANKAMGAVFQKANINFKNYINQQHKAMTRQIYDRTKIYIEQLTKQINSLDTPLSKTEMDNYNACMKEIGDFKIKIEHLQNQIQEYL
jgi:GTPase SAR1 family protein